MVEPSDAQIAEARERGRIAQQREPRAVAARYDAKTGRVVVELTNGATFAFPPALVEGSATLRPTPWPKSRSRPPASVSTGSASTRTTACRA